MVHHPFTFYVVLAVILLGEELFLFFSYWLYFFQKVFSFLEEIALSGLRRVKAVFSK